MGAMVMWKRLMIFGTAIRTLGGLVQTAPGPDPSESSYLPVVKDDSQTALARTGRGRV